MTIIRDEELQGLKMIPLFHQYGVHYCHVEGCHYKATTLLTDTDTAIPVIGICEYHYNEAKLTGKWSLKLDISTNQQFKPIE